MQLEIATDAPTPSRLALDIAPTNAIGDGLDEDSVMLALRSRVGTYVSGVP